MKTCLCIIDPQNDFTDIPSDIANGFKGALAVSGAWQDSLRLVQHIQKTNPDAIYVTIDTHEKYDVAHPTFWKDSNGQHPQPFTIISSKDILDGAWTPIDSNIQGRMVQYAQSLEQQGLFPLCVWPEHCLKDTFGHQVVDVVQQALDAWEIKNNKKVTYVVKGTNPYTEHYGAFAAEVVDPLDHDTELKTDLIDEMNTYDSIEFCGQALSHCVNRSVSQAAQHLGTAQKFVLLRDMTSPVTGFEHLADDFIQRLTAQGMKLNNKKRNIKIKM